MFISSYSYINCRKGGTVWRTSAASLGGQHQESPSTPAGRWRRRRTTGLVISRHWSPQTGRTEPRLLLATGPEVLPSMKLCRSCLARSPAIQCPRMRPKVSLGAGHLRHLTLPVFLTLSNPLPLRMCGRHPWTGQVSAQSGVAVWHPGTRVQPIDCGPPSFIKCSFLYEIDSSVCGKQDPAAPLKLASGPPIL